MTYDEIIKEIDNSIAHLSESEAIEFLEDLASDIESRIAGLECDMENY